MAQKEDDGSSPRSSKTYKEFSGMNTQDERYGAEDTEFPWLENIMMVGDGKLHSISGPSGIVATFPFPGSSGASGALTAQTGIAASFTFAVTRTALLTAATDMDAQRGLTGMLSRSGELTAVTGMSATSSTGLDQNVSFSAATGFTANTDGALLQEGGGYILQEGVGRILL